jgi:carbamoyl-phosphate synthase large subunit
MRNVELKNRVLIAGIGTGSLGMELLKCFELSEEFELYGADVSENAYGHNDNTFVRTKVLSNKNIADYSENLLRYAIEIKADIIAPGADAVHKILSEYRDMFFKQGIELMINSNQVVHLCSDKAACNEFLARNGFITAKTIRVTRKDDLLNFNSYPCVIKPAADSGGSNMVFLAENMEEASFFVDYLTCRGFKACMQEYIDSEDEFTIGVMSNRNGDVLTSIALRRSLESKLSRAMSYGNRVISSGWSQGEIDYFPEICQQAENIAKSMNSTWALNLQGRVLNGVFVPFEINPRHSGTSYLRALAGVNEPVIALELLYSDSSRRPVVDLKVGHFYRILKEYYIPRDV